MSTTHKHHIIPRHMGGSDDPTNLIELSIEDHASAHKTLWETHGLWQDFLAWRMLSGQISAGEASQEAQKMGQRLGGLMQSKEHKSRAGKSNTYENRVKAAEARYLKHGHIHSKMTPEATKRYEQGKSLGGKVGGSLCHTKKSGAFKVMLCYECGKISTTRWIKHHLFTNNHVLHGEI